MTREEIAAIYLQVADEVGNGKEWCWHGVDGPLPRFAALIAAAEREACARLAINQKNNVNQHDRRPYNLACNHILDAIRARGGE